MEEEKVEQVSQAIIEVQNEENYILEYLHFLNVKLALLCEVLLPSLNKPTALFQGVYTVTFHLRNEIDSVGVSLGFSKFLADVDQAFKQLHEGFAGFVGQFSTEELNVVHHEADKLSLGQLLELPLAFPLVLANVVARLKRKSKDESLEPIVTNLASVFAELTLASSNAKDEEQQTKKILQSDLRPVKKGFLHDLFHRPPPVYLNGDTHKFLGKLEGLRMAMPREPTRLRDVKFYVFSDVVLVVARESATLLFSMDPGAIVVSLRRELGVGDVASSADCSFSLFWNKGGGKVEQMIFFAASRIAAHHTMSRLHAASLLRVNSTRTKSMFLLVRERKPFQGRSNDFGAEYHFAVWAFGKGTIIRLDADTGKVIQKYKSRELKKFAPLRSEQNEERVRVVFSTESFDLSSYGVCALVPLLKLIAHHRDETNFQLRKKMRQPFVSLASMSRAEQEALRQQWEREAQLRAAAHVQRQLQSRLGEIQSEYNAVSLQLYEREAQIRELETELASKNAPGAAVIQRFMTPKERLEAQNEAQTVDFSSETI